MNIATILTASRLVFAPIFAFFFLQAYRHPADAVLWLWLAVATALCIELSDAFDGFFARKYHQVTNFGKIFDPICDSLSRQTIFISFMITGIIPVWMFLIFLYRDGLMSLLRIMCAAEGTVMAAKKSGKLKAIIQAIAAFAVLGWLLLKTYSIGILPNEWFGRPLGFWIMIVPAAITFISFFDYFLPNMDVLKRQMVPKK
jgi:CDP-diacylglycerol--glycerol-3-phosphate 3-phosphatidyltransferase